MKAILFDFDGVLTTDKTGSQSILHYLAQRTGIGYEVLKPAYYRHNRALLYGGCTHRDMWAAFCAEVGKDIDYGLLTEAFRHTPMDADMLALAWDMKREHLIGLVTDNKQDRMDEVLAYFDLQGLFDAVAVSATVGSGKEEEHIFRSVLDALHVAAEDCVFIDNTAKNLIVPESMGMRTILFDDEKRGAAALRKQLDIWKNM